MTCHARLVWGRRQGAQKTQRAGMGWKTGEPGGGFKRVGRAGFNTCSIGEHQNSTQNRTLCSLRSVSELSVLDCSVWMLASPRSLARLPNLTKAKPTLYTLQGTHSTKWPKHQTTWYTSKHTTVGYYRYLAQTTTGCGSKTKMRPHCKQSLAKY